MSDPVVVYEVGDRRQRMPLSRAIARAVQANRDGYTPRLSHEPLRDSWRGTPEVIYRLRDLDHGRRHR